VNTVLDDLHDWHGLDFNEALRRSFSGVMQHAKKRIIGVIPLIADKSPMQARLCSLIDNHIYTAH
jgi:hypothetical protein